MDLKFFNLIDANEKLSLINLSIYFMLLKCMIFQTEIYDALIFVCLIAAHCIQRIQDRLEKVPLDLEEKFIKFSDYVSKDMSDIHVKVHQIHLESESRKELSEKMEKQSQEMQKLINAETFKRAFNPRNQML